MKTSTYKQIKVITANSGQDFEQQFNDTMKEHAKESPEVVFQKPFIAYITWTASRDVPENVTDEFHLKGIRYKCSECPYLEVGNDKRRKTWPCRYAEYGESCFDTECCELFYKRLMQGSITPKEVIK